MKVKIVKDFCNFKFLGIKIGDVYEVKEKREETKKYLIFLPQLNGTSLVYMNNVCEVS